MLELDINKLVGINVRHIILSVAQDWFFRIVYKSSGF